MNESEVTVPVVMVWIAGADGQTDNSAYMPVS